MGETPAWSEPGSDADMSDQALEHAQEVGADDEPKFGDDVDLTDSGEKPPPDPA